MSTADAERGPSKGRKFDFPLDEIPRLKSCDPQVDELIKNKQPVVITDSGLVASALKWDLDYLEQNMENNEFIVFLSKDHIFKFYDEKKVIEKIAITGAHAKHKCAQEVPRPTRRVNMKMYEFAQRMKSWKEGDERMYLQQALNSGTSPAVVQDFLRFRWDWVTAKKELHNWGKLTYNLLLIGMGGNVTPCHYDEQENLFAQIHGYKRCILFPPEKFECLYPHPVYHPHDRQSQVDLERLDYNRFPKARELRGMETVLEPGDVLYIPIYWWHHIESAQHAGYTISLNFWFKAGPVGNIEYPIKEGQKVAIMRNVEKMLAEAMQDPEEIGPLLRALVLGRFTE